MVFGFGKNINAQESKIDAPSIVAILSGLIGLGLIKESSS
jgi:hypothetical protein